MAEHDLTQTLIQYLDRHHVLPLLDFLVEKKLYKPEDILKAKIQLVSKTKMIDIWGEVHMALHNESEFPEDIKAAKSQVITDLYALRDACGPLLALCTPEKASALHDRDRFTWEQLRAETPELEDKHLDNLYKYAKFLSDCGQYEDCEQYLECFLQLSRDEDRKFEAQWGKLSSCILLNKFEAALENLHELSKAVEGRVRTSHVERLQQRSWLMHWSLFIFFNLPDGRDKLSKLMFEDKYINTIQVNCPHLLRYLAAAVVLNFADRKMKDQHDLKQLIRIIQIENEMYSDPVTQFLSLLFVDYNFERATAMLEEVETVFNNDFFLCEFTKEFIRACRLLLFKITCQTHECMDVASLGKQMDAGNLSEPRIVELIREIQLDAKIDSNNNQILMNRPKPSPYKDLLDKTRSLYYRSVKLNETVDKKLRERQEA